MSDAPCAVRGIVDLAGIRLGTGDEFPQVRHRQYRGIDHQQVRTYRKDADGLKIPDGIEGQLSIEAGIDGQRSGVRDQGGIAVRRRARHHLRTDDAGSPRPVVDHDRLAQRRGELPPDDTRDVIGAAAGGERHDKADRLVGIALCERWRGNDG